MLDAPEILDPFGEPSAAQEAIADEVEDLSRRLAVALFASVA
jgi:hypothetical protein